MSTCLSLVDDELLSLQACHIHTLTDHSSLANTYIINDFEIIVVDPGLPQNVPAIISYVRHFLKRDEEDIGLIGLTHLHRDHAAGALHLQERTGARLAVSMAASAVPDLRQGISRRGSWPGTGFLARRLLPGAFQHLNLTSRQHESLCASVDYWLLDDDCLPGHPQWKVLATPGHTPESLCLYNFLSGELLCGDTLTTVEYDAALPRHAPHDHGALQLALARLRRLRIRFIFPSHGRPLLATSPLAYL